MRFDGSDEVCGDHGKITRLGHKSFCGLDNLIRAACVFVGNLPIAQVLREPFATDISLYCTWRSQSGSEV